MNKSLYKKILSFVVIITNILSICFFNVYDSYAEFDIDPFGHVYRHVNIIDTALLNDNMITYEEIPDLIFNYNPTVRNLWNNFEVKKESDEIADDYYEAADAYESMDAPDEVSSAQYEAKARGFRMQGDNNVIDSNINYLSNIKTEKSIIYATRLSMINYHKSILEKEKAEKSLEEIKRKVDSAKINYENGNLTKSELLKVESELKINEANLILAESNIINYKRNVLINCGYVMDDNVEIVDMPHIIISSNSLNYKNDVEKALSSNFQFEIFKRSLANAKSEEMKNTYKINVDNAARLIESDLEAKERQLKNAITSDTTYNLKVEDMRNELDKATNQMNEGSISKKEYETSKYNYELSILDAKLSKYDIDLAYIDYVEAVEGLADAGGQ